MGLLLTLLFAIVGTAATILGICIIHRDSGWHWPTALWAVVAVLVFVLWISVIGLIQNLPPLVGS